MLRRVSMRIGLQEGEAAKEESKAMAVEATCRKRGIDSNKVSKGEMLSMG